VASPSAYRQYENRCLFSYFFAAQLPNKAIIDLLEQQLAARREKLAECIAIKLPSLGDQFAVREQIVQQLVLGGIKQTYIDWLKTAIDVINHH